MNCTNCGVEMEENAKFCCSCGTAATQPQPEPAVEAVQETAPAPAPAPAPIVKEVVRQVIPDAYQPMSPWGFLGLQILYSVPIVGLVFMIIFTFSKGNMSRRNFTRSYWCALLVLAIIAVLFIAVVLILALLSGMSFGAMAEAAGVAGAVAAPIY